MRKAILVLLMITAGCATLPNHAPVTPVAPLQQPALQAEPKVQTATLREPDRQQPVLDRAEVSIPPKAAETSPAVIPEEPSTAHHETPPAAQHHQEKTARLSNELPVPNHKLQGLVELAEKNDEKIMNVFVGMYRRTVEDIMGTGRNPFKRQSITGTDDQVYEILYYLTREPRKGRPITDRMLTPIIFKKGRVAAIGAYQLKKLIQTGTLGRQKASKNPAS
jgi:hypothetical protein